GAIAATGHINIARKSYWDSSLGTDSNDTVMNAKEVEQILAALKGLSSVAWNTNKVLEFNGLIGTEKKSAIFIGSAIENTRNLQQSLPVDGSGIYSDDSGYVMISKGLSRNIGAKPEGPLQLSVNTPYGLALYTQELSGIVEMPDMNADKMLLFTNLANAWELLGNEGSIHKLQVHIIESKVEAKLIREISSLIEREFPDLQSKDWETLNPQFRSVMQMYNAVLYFLMLNFLVFIFISILQTVLAIFLERTKEFGTLRALGISKGKLVRMVLYEMLLLAGLAVACGLLFVYVIKYSILANGVTFTPPNSTMAFPIDFYFQSRELLAVVILPIIFTIFLGCVYPLLRIVRMKVRTALEG
ncbi:MAG: FtsX-like permease family protein, partial [Spirochaetota bacterium]